MQGRSKHLRYEGCPRCISNGKDTRNDNLSIFSDGGSHCWSCGYHHFPKYYVGEQREKEKLNAAVLPTDFTREVPGHALKWLLQYHLPFSYWSPFIGWSEKDSRLVFTVGAGPEFSIGRYIQGDDHQDKLPRKWYAYGNCHESAHILGDYTKASQIVLVEDLISAHKLSSVVPTICLFGTRVFDGCIPTLRHIGLAITLWLDKDQEGTMPKQCQRLETLTGLPVTYVVTTSDPKCLTLEKINETLRT